MHREGILKNVYDLKAYTKEMRDKDMEYNKAEREKMIDIITASPTDKLMVMEVTLDKGIKDLEKRVQNYHEVLVKDMNGFDAKLKDMVELFDIDTFIRKINHLNAKKERLYEDRINSVEGRMESMSIALRSLEERHHV